MSKSCGNKNRTAPDHYAVSRRYASIYGGKERETRGRKRRRRKQEEANICGCLDCCCDCFLKFIVNTDMYAFGGYNRSDGFPLTCYWFLGAVDMGPGLFQIFVVIVFFRGMFTESTTYYLRLTTYYWLLTTDYWLLTTTTTTDHWLRLLTTVYEPSNETLLNHLTTHYSIYRF